MTTVDPYQYRPDNSQGTLANVLDPSIKVWENVTYADNYTQFTDGGTASGGQDLEGADWNVYLGDRAGFNSNASTSTPNPTTLTWYTGTADVSYGQRTNEDKVFRRLGDLVQASIPESTRTWYTPDHTNAVFIHGAAEAPWEGIGTGWFSSVLGGGLFNKHSKGNTGCNRSSSLR